MPELPFRRTTARLRRTTLSTLCALSLGSLAAPVLAQNVPAGLRACTAESDSARRLACYDREMARLTAPPPSAAAAAAPAAQAGQALQPAAGLMPSKPDFPPRSHLTWTPTPTPTPTSEPAPTAGAVASTPATPAGGHETASPHRSRLWNILGAGPSSRLTAHVASLDRWPDAMVLHLDNGQVWQQVGRASGDLSLQAGDSVTIEKHLGSYWLSARHVSNMQVRLKPQ